MTNIIKVKFFRGSIPAGKEYTYLTPEPVDVGDVVDIETKMGKTRAMVCQVDVPEAEIAPFRARAKSIIGRAQCQCERCEEFTPIGSAAVGFVKQKAAPRTQPQNDITGVDYIG